MTVEDFDRRYTAVAATTVTGTPTDEQLSMNGISSDQIRAMIMAHGYDARAAHSAMRHYRDAVGRRMGMFEGLPTV